MTVNQDKLEPQVPQAREPQVLQVQKAPQEHRDQMELQVLLDPVAQQVPQVVPQVPQVWQVPKVTQEIPAVPQVQREPLVYQVLRVPLGL